MRREAMYPVFLDMRRRRCLVVGGGAVAERKARGLAAAGATVRVVAIEPTAGLIRLARGGGISLRRRAFSPGDLDGAFLCVAAAGDGALNAGVSREARRRGVLVNVADSPALCDFYLPALVSRGRLQIAVSTGGGSPALARRIREEIERRYGSEYGVLLGLAATGRKGALQRLPTARRAAAFRRMTGPAVRRALLRGGRAAARREMGRILAAAEDPGPAEGNARRGTKG